MALPVAGIFFSVSDRLMSLSFFLFDAVLRVAKKTSFLTQCVPIRYIDE